MLPALAVTVLISLLGAGSAPSVPLPAPADEREVVSIRDLAADGPQGLVPSARARSLAGEQIRLVGFMVETEEPSVGGFWVASRPVECDEGGGGTGDLPPDAVRVVLRANPGELVPHVPGPLVVTGVLEIGGDPGPDVPPSAFRLVVDRRATLTAANP